MVCAVGPGRQPFQRPGLSDERKAWGGPCRSAVLRRVGQESGYRWVMKRSSSPRRLAAPRVARFNSWKELQAAVLAWCHARVREENPTFDVAQLEHQLRAWVNDQAHSGDAAYEHHSKVLSTLSAADKFLKADPLTAERSLFGALLEGIFSARVEGNDGGFGMSVRERLAHSRPITKAERWPLGSSARSRLVALFANAPPNVLWWKERTPKVLLRHA